MVLAVVGTMKAGKSSTINALVGREILPNRNRPMTSLPTLIAHKTGQTEAVLNFPAQAVNDYISKIKKLDLTTYNKTKNKEGEDVEAPKEILDLISNIQKGYKFLNSYKGDEAICNFLAHLNDLVRLARDISKNDNTLSFPFTAYTDVTALPRIEVEFSTLKHIDTNTSAGRLVLLDTPGPNEANIPELQTIFEQQLQRCSAVMLVLNYRQLGTKDEQDVRNEVNKLPAIKKEQLFALVNQFDAKNKNSDGEEATKSHISNNLLAGKIYSDNIFCISALRAFLARAFQDHVGITQQKPKFEENGYISDFAEMVSLDDEDEWEDITLKELINKANRKFEQSNIQSVLDEIITKNFKNAPALAFKTAFQKAEAIFTDIENALSIKSAFAQEIEMTDKEIKSIEDALRNIGHQLGILHTVKNEVQGDLKKLEEDVKEKTDELVEFFNLNANKICNEAIKGLLTAKESSNATKSTQMTWKKWMKFDNDYYHKKSKYEQNKEDAQASQSHKMIKFTEGEYNNLCKDLVDLLVIGANHFKAKAKMKTDPLQENIAQKSKQTNHKLQESIQSIQSAFSERNITVSVPNFYLPEFFMPELNVTQESILKGITNTQDETRTVESTASFSGIKRTFGGWFGQDDWGYEEKTFTYKTVKQAEFCKRFVEVFDQQICKPIVKPIQTTTQQFVSQNQEQLNQLTQTLEQLKNELETNLQLEQDQPIEEKKARKAMLKAIFDANQAITNSMQVLRPLIETTEEIA